MSDKPEALRLADGNDECAKAWLESSDAYKFRKDTAAELRRLNAECERLERYATYMDETLAAYKEVSAKEAANLEVLVDAWNKRNEQQASGAGCAECERLRARIEVAFYDGYNSRSTYNDMDLRDVDDEWAKQKEGLLNSTAARKEQA